MRYSRLLLFALVSYMIALPVMYAIHGNTAMVDAWTIVLAELMACTFIVILLTLSNRSLEMELMFATGSLLFLLPGLFVYLQWPHLVPFGGDWQLRIVADDVNRGFIFIIASTVMAVFGMRLAGWLVPPRGRLARSTAPFISIPLLLLLGFGSMAIELFLGLYYGKFNTDLGSSAMALGFLTRLISSDAFIFIAITTVIHRWRVMKKWERKALGFGLLVAVAHRTLTGSRQTLLIVLIICAGTLFDRVGDFRISRRALKMTALAIAGSFITFPAATVVRDYWRYSAKAEHYLTLKEFREAQEEGDRLPGMFYLVGSRLNGLDPIAAVATDRGKDKDLYVTVPVVIESFINIVTPGTPFPEAREMSKTFLVVYRGYKIDYLDFYYVTTMWTLWGNVWSLLGFLGGAVSLFFVGAVMVAGFALLTRRRNRSNGYWRTLAVYSMYLLVVSFGFDSDLAAVIYYVIPMAVMMGILGVYGRARRRRNVRATIPRSFVTHAHRHPTSG